MMKEIKKTNLLVRWFQLALISLVLCWSCINFSDVKSPLDGIKIMINYNIFNTFLSLTFVDAATGTPIGASNNEFVNVQISGASAPAVVDQLGNHKTSYSTVFGLLSLAMNPKDPWKPSLKNKLNLRIDATCANYKSSTLNLQIDSTGKYQCYVLMEKTGTDATGIKKYILPLTLNAQGQLTQDVSYTSTGNETTVSLKKGTQFINSSGAVEMSSPINLMLTVYTRLNVAPVPGALLENIILKDKSVQLAALDIYRVVDVRLSNESLQPLTSTGINPIVIRFKIDSLAYHPVTRTSVGAGSDVKAYTWLPNSTAWQPDDSTKISSDSLGYYSVSSIYNTGVHAAGMHIPLCVMSGQLAYSLQGSYPAYPVPTTVSVYRKIDSRYIGNGRLDAPQSGAPVAMNFSVPQNTPVRSNINPYSGAIGFSAKPNSFDFTAGCGAFGQVASQLTYSPPPPPPPPPPIIPTVPVTGSVQISVADGFSTDPFNIIANIVQTSNNQVLWSNRYSIGKTNNQFNISANLVPNNAVYLQILAANNQNSFTCTPANYSFNTGSATGLSWQFAVVPIYANINLSLNFTRSEDLPNTTYSVKAKLINMADQSDVQDIIFQVIPGQSSYTARLTLSKLIQYQVNLKRVDGAPTFMAYPYQFVMGYISRTDYAYTFALSPVVIKPEAFSVKVVCKKTEIIPTLHGYYRTVWDDLWQQTDIINGILNINCEINGTYVVGMIVNGKMETGTYLFDGTKLDFNFSLDDANCAKMGW